MSKLQNSVAGKAFGQGYDDLDIGLQEVVDRIINLVIDAVKKDLAGVVSSGGSCNFLAGYSHAKSDFLDKLDKLKTPLNESTECCSHCRKMKPISKGHHYHTLANMTGGQVSEFGWVCNDCDKPRHNPCKTVEPEEMGG